MNEERIIRPEIEDTREENLEQTLRPQILNDYIMFAMAKVPYGFNFAIIKFNNKDKTVTFIKSDKLRCRRHFLCPEGVFVYSERAKKCLKKQTFKTESLLFVLRLILTEECLMNSGNCLICKLLVDKNGDCDFTCGNHADVDACFIKSAEHL